MRRAVRKNGLWVLVVLLPLLGEGVLRTLYPVASHTFHQRQSEFYGWLSVVVLLTVLLARPLKLVDQRRLLGVAAALFALLHSWLAFDAVLDRDWESVSFLSVPDQWALWLGLVSLVGFLPLLLTSTPQAMRKLGPRWKTLHRLNPLLTVLAILHTVWLGVHFGVQPLAWTSVGLLLVTLLVLLYRWKGLSRLKGKKP